MKLKNESVYRVSLDQIEPRYASLRLTQPKELAEVRRYMGRTSAIAPLLCNQVDERLILVDGFKRYHILREQQTQEALVRVVRLSEAAAQLAILTENAARQGLCEIEQAWVIKSVVRNCGFAQKDVADALKCHLSWVSRRLSLAERLEPSVQEDMRLGLIHPTAARELVRLPRGKQAQVAETIRHHRLSSRQVIALVQVLQACGDDQTQAVLSEPLRYLESSRLAAKRQGRGPCAARGSLGYWLLRLSEAVQRVELAVGGMLPDQGDVESMALLAKQAPQLIAQLEHLRRTLRETLGPQSLTEDNDEP